MREEQCKGGICKQNALKAGSDFKVWIKPALASQRKSKISLNHDFMGLTGLDSGICKSSIIALVIPVKRLVFSALVEIGCFMCKAILTNIARNSLIILIN